MEQLGDKKRLVIGGTVVLTVLAVLLMGLISTIQYESEIEEYREYLTGKVEAHARLIDIIRALQVDPSLPAAERRERVVEQLRQRYPNATLIGETGAFVLGYRDGDRIRFMREVSHGAIAPPDSVPWGEGIAKPMELALSGQTGTIIANDFRGERVIAAYQPLPSMQVGVVGKVDLAELRGEYLSQALFTAFLAALITSLGGAGLLRWQVGVLRRVEAKEAHQRALLESAGDGILGTSSDGTIIWSNGAAAGIFECEPDEMCGHNVSDYLLEFGGGQLEITDFSGSTADHLTAIARRSTGQEFRAEVSVAEVKVESSENTNEFVVVVRDLSEQRKAELLLARQSAELEIARRRAEQANLAKSEFLANMSHEIRTPMTAILGFADVLTEKDICDTEREAAISTIRRNGVHLLNLINDILDLSKIESGRVETELLPIDPCRVVAEVVSLMGVRFADKDVALEVEYTSKIPEHVVTDATRLRQILINLLGNAIKFTEKGKVELLVSLQQNGEESTLQFDVADTGVGMTPEQLGNIFQPFAQADNSTTRIFGGTGLGLVISRRFAKMLGGDVVVVSSELGVGTRFRVSVATGPLEGVKLLQRRGKAPHVLSGSSYERKPKGEPLLGYQILLAEDGADNQRLISRILGKLGATVVICDNGERAFQEAQAAKKANKPYDVILMDVQMPILDGLSATEKLRSHGYDGAIIALTAHAMAGDRERCLEAGCDEYTTKPVRKHELVAHIGRLVPTPRELQEEPAGDRKLETA